MRLLQPGIYNEHHRNENEWVNEERTEASEEDILSYLAGNLCRCTGYMGHIRALRRYFAAHSIDITGCHTDLSNDYIGEVK